MQRYNTIFFDVGNTLLKPSPPVTVTMANVVKRNRGIEIDPAHFDANMDLLDRHYSEVYAHDGELWSEHELQLKMWLDGYRKLLRAVGIEDDVEELVNEIYNEYDKPEVWATYKGAISTLEEFKARGFKVGIISNWGRGLKELLDSLGFAAAIDYVVCSAEVNSHKPKPEIFEMALEALDSTAYESIHVGDHADADVAGAQRVGITPILISHKSEELFSDLTNCKAEEDTLKVNSLPEILRVVECLNAQ